MRKTDRSIIVQSNLDKKVGDYYEQFDSIISDPDGKKIAVIQVQEMPQDIDIKDFQKQMNKKGHCITGEKFYKYPYSNTRSEAGTFHARVENEEEVKTIIERMERKGITANVVEKRKPLWKN